MSISLTQTVTVGKYVLAKHMRGRREVSAWC